MLWGYKELAVKGWIRMTVLQHPGIWKRMHLDCGKCVILPNFGLCEGR